MNTHKAEQGFTLIEVMIAVAIVAILAAVAYPSYLDSITKGRRAEGRTALLELLQQQERYNTQRNTYLAFTTDPSNGSTNPTAPFKVFSGGSLTSSAYTLSAEACSATTSIQDCVRLVATPLPNGSHKNDVNIAGNLRITSTGAKDCTGPKAATPGLCWP